MRDKRSELASKINVMTGSNYHADARRESTSVVYRLSNTSDAPAYWVLVSMLRWTWKSDETAIVTHTYESLLPASVTDEDQFLDIDLPHPTDAPAPAPVSVEFTDGRGRRWRRMPDATLYLQKKNDKWKLWR